MKYSKLQCGIASALLLSSSAYADIKFNGFATIVGGITTGSDETLHGFDDTFDFAEGSHIGLQANADLGEGLSAVGQIISRGKDEWDAEFEWAYLGYELNDNVKFIAGRQRAPFYMYSDYIDVGYAYHFIAPPEGVYSIPVTSMDGLGAIFDFNMGETENTVQILYGRTNEDLDILGFTLATDAGNAFVSAYTMTYDWLTLRASFGVSELSTDTSTLGVSDDLTLNGLAEAWQGTPFPQVTDEILVDDDDITFWGVGTLVDLDNWLFVAEYTYTDYGDNLLPEYESYYASIGYRFDNIMIHFTYGGDEDEAYDDALNGVLARLPVPPTPPADALQYAILHDSTATLLDAGGSDETYYQVGLRWDFHPSAALKFEYTDWENDYKGDYVVKDNDAGLFRVAITTVF